MNWFLVLLFWNPAIQGYDVADGWYPIPYATETICEMRLDFMNMYLTSVNHFADCVESPAMWPAIEEVKEAAND